MDIYRNGVGADRVAPGLSLVPKLKYEHIYLTSFSKMRVDLAAQVMYNNYTCIVYSIMFRFSVKQLQKLWY